MIYFRHLNEHTNASHDNYKINMHLDSEPTLRLVNVTYKRKWLDRVITGISLKTEFMSSKNEILSTCVYFHVY